MQHIVQQSIKATFIKHSKVTICKMLSYNQNVQVVATFVTITYIISALIVISHYVNLKYKIRKEIKNLPSLKRVGVDLNKVMTQKNKILQSTVSF